MQLSSNVTAGAAISPAVTVDVENANGIIVANDTSTVTISINSGPGTIGGTFSAAAR